MATENEKYHQMAIAWGEAFVTNKTISESFCFKEGETITDDINFVSVQVARIKNSKGAELKASYNRLRVFKHFYEALIKSNNE